MKGRSHLVSVRLTYIFNEALCVFRLCIFSAHSKRFWLRFTKTLHAIFSLNCQDFHSFPPRSRSHFRLFSYGFLLQLEYHADEFTQFRAANMQTSHSKRIYPLVTSISIRFTLAGSRLSYAHIHTDTNTN